MPYTVDAATSGCYEGTTVLINKFGLRDAEALAEVEAAVVPAKAAMWEAKPLCETFDFGHYMVRGLMAKLRVLSNEQCMDLVKDIQKNYHLPYPA